jgi:hypothetical protein
MKKFSKWLGAVALSALLGATGAQANTITLTGTQAPAGSFTEFSYHAMLGGDSILETGDYFVVYDFNGFAGFDTTFGSSSFVFTGTTGNWLASLSSTGPDPIGDGTVGGVLTLHPPSAANDTGLLNLIFTYVGPNVVSPPNATLVTVSALAGNSTVVPISYGSQDHSSLTGLPQGSIPGTVAGPGPGGPTDFLPTPAAATGGLGLIVLLGASRRRR